MSEEDNVTPIPHMLDKAKEAIKALAALQKEHKALCTKLERLVFLYESTSQEHQKTAFTTKDENLKQFYIRSGQVHEEVANAIKNALSKE